MPGLTTNISRRGVLAVAAAGAATVALVPLSPASADAPTAGQVPPVPASPPATLAELEATAMALKPPVFLLETVVPAQFSTSDKSPLSIVSEVNHTGNSSLRWDYKSRSVLTVQAPLGIVPPSAASGGAMGRTSVWMSTPWLSGFISPLLHLGSCASRPDAAGERMPGAR